MDISESRDDLTSSPFDQKRIKRPALLPEDSLANISASIAASDIKRLFSDNTAYNSSPMCPQVTKSGIKFFIVIKLMTSIIHVFKICQR